MLGIMLQKMWHKRWMNLCLLLGCTLLVATVVSFPLYQKAAYDRMLQDEIRNYISENGVYPTQLNMGAISKNDKGGATIKKLEDFQGTICETLGVTPKRTMKFFFLLNSKINSDMNRSDADPFSLSLAFATDFPDNVKMVAGEMYSDDGLTEDGAIEVVISQDTMLEQGLLVGERLTFDTMKTMDKKPITIVISGVFVQDSEDPFYWQMPSKDLKLACFMQEDLFCSMFTGDNAGKFTINSNFYNMFEYEDIEYEQVNNILEKTQYLTKKSKYKSVLDDAEYYELFENYNKKVNRISATLIILQVPVLIMLAAFLLMISGQMYEMEKNEISVIKSRGSSRGQIFRLYLYQGIVLTLAGGILGIPLGALFSKVLGSVRNFLDFNGARSLTITYTGKSFLYALAAMLITLLTITIPAIGHSKVSIVNLKQSKNVIRKAWWQKFFLDFILLGIAGYGYYNFNKNVSDVSGTVLSGESLDPLLYISSSLFIVGMGLLYIRIQPLLIKLVFTIGKRHWGPASYISFMETIKQSGKQQLIILFLIMTVSLGMYHSTVARTILENAVNNTEYVDGADMILAEKWEEAVDQEGNKTGVWVEPDYKKFASMPFAESYTRVYNDSNAFLSGEKNNRQQITIMGIHTKDFGSMTYVDKSIMGKHYYEYLNELAADQKGVILSSNFKTKLGYDIGDNIDLNNQNKTKVTCKIIDFFDYWPGYAPTLTTINPDGSAETADNYLAVMHYDNSRNAFGVQPYEIWITLKPDANESQIAEWIDNTKFKVKRYVNRDKDLEITTQDPLLQGTNGVLTLGFVVTIVLCAVGYMIYWIMSIKDRELIFGVLRASGFHKKEVVQMLLIEQLFAGVLSVLAGIGIGWISSKMFVPIIQTSFASATQILPLRLIIENADLLRLYGVIALVMASCLAVLITLLFKMNVTKALKLGEE